MRKLLVLFFGFMLAADSAYALRLVYKFNIESSGPTMYACNVGIRHDGGQVCHIRGNPGQSCEPNLVCAPGQDCNINNCICTGPNGGESFWDVVNGRYFPYTEVNEAPSGGQNFEIRSNRNTWQTLFNDTDAFNWQLGASDIANTSGDGVTFVLTSEVMSASYFVDICYRGPQIVAPNGNINNVYVFSSSAYGSDHLGRPLPNSSDIARYTELSDLAASVRIQCYEDLNSAPFYEQTFDGGLMNGQRVNFVTTDVISNLSRNGQIPRFCRVRYFFEETNGGIRLNTFQGTRMCVDTTIEDSETQSQQSGLGL